MLLLSYFFAFLIGLLPGLIGAGGSILAIPVFVYIMGYGAKIAIGMSLMVVAVTSAIGSFKYCKDRYVHLKTVVIFGPLAMLGARLGAKLAIYISSATQLMFFAITTLGASYFMFFDKASLEKPESKKFSFVILAIQGFLVGVLSGLVGVGGGFIIVPTLVLFGKIPMKQAVGSSLVIMAMQSSTAFVVYLNQIQIPWRYITIFTSIATLGMLTGAYTVRFLPAKWLKKAFAIFVFCMGLFVFFKNI